MLLGAGALRIDRTCRPVGLLKAHRIEGALVAVLADGPVSRAIGVLGTSDLRMDEALVLAPCSSVHGIGLRCVIGVVFVDAAGTVLRVVDPLPWWGARLRRAHAVIEARSGVLAALRPGDTISVDDEHIFPLRGNSASR